MDIRMQTRTAMFLAQIANPLSETSPCIPYSPVKPEYDTGADNFTPLPSSTPESQGVSSDLLSDFISELKNDPSLSMHSVIVIRNGFVICDVSFGDSRSDVWHVTHSLCKTLTGLAVGLLVDEGKLFLSDKVVRILEKRVSPIAQFTYKNMTVEHLLTMSSGMNFNEANAMCETEWIRGFFDGGAKFEAGTSFNYNSLNSYILSAIVTQITGMPLDEYLKKKIFKPLGIRKYFWERSPEGITKGGWGMYLCPHDAAKIALLMMNKGMWQGRRLISENWINESVVPRKKTLTKVGNFDYGYHVWTAADGSSYLLNGMFGQNAIVYPKTKTILVSTAGNEEMFQQSSYFVTAKKYFGESFAPSDFLPEDKKALSRLEKTKASCAFGKPDARIPLFASVKEKQAVKAFGKEWMKISGASFDMTDPPTNGLGVMPLMMQAITSNYAGGIKRISFSGTAENPTVTVTEKDGAKSYRVSVTAPVYDTVAFRGEKYIVSCRGSFSENEDGLLCLKLVFGFTEYSNARTLKIFFSNDLSSVQIRFSEKPDISFTLDKLSELVGELPGGKLMDALYSMVDLELIKLLARLSFVPSLSGTRIPS